MQITKPLPLLFAATALCANTQEKVPELSFFERAELPEATLLNTEQFGQKIIDSYPMPLIRRDVQGTAKISVLVTTNGRATNCQIRKSSGDSIIDQWACRGTVRYARFTPATDEEGEPVLSQWSQEFTLTLGNPQPETEASQI